MVGKVQKSVYLSEEVLKKINDIRRAGNPIPSFSAVVAAAVMAYGVWKVPEEEKYVYGSPEQIAELEKTDPEAAERMRDYIRAVERSSGVLR